MGRLREIINIFINPIPPEKSLDELAADAGIGEADLKLLKSSMGGVTNFKFADDEVEETRKGKTTKVVTNKEMQPKSTPKTVIEQEPKKGQERD